MQIDQKFLNIGVILLHPYTKATDKHHIQCSVCNHQYFATILSKTQSYKKYGHSGCPNCHKLKSNTKYHETREQNLEIIKSRGLIILSAPQGLIRSSTNIVKFQNTNCGHIFESLLGNVLNKNIVCTVCGKQSRIDNMNIRHETKRASRRLTHGDWNQYKNTVHNISKQNYNKNSSKINPFNLPLGLAGLPNAHHLDHCVSIRMCFDHNIPHDIAGSVENLQILPWLKNLEKKESFSNVPDSIRPYLIGSNVVKSTFISNIKSRFKWNIDQDVNINGMIFDLHKNDTYIKYITSSCVEQNVGKRFAVTIQNSVKDLGTAIIVFEDEYLDNPQLVISKLCHIMGANVDSKQVYARNCELITNINILDKKAILNQYHIQGYHNNHQVSLGLTFENKLIALMTFCLPRVEMGRQNNNDGIWELSRFVTDTNYRIPGAASKLLTAFERQYSPKLVYSYADARWSVGNVYEKLGFVRTKVNPPAYWYMIEGRRKHRWGYRKDILKNIYEQFDSDKTEYQMMLEQGIDRIWDCGTIVYEKSY